MRTNTNKYRNNLSRLIRNCVEMPDGTTPTNIETAIDVIKLRFDSEFNHDHNKRRYPNHQERLSEYLMGLPFDFPYLYCDIIPLVNELHEDVNYCKGREGRICEGYWNHLAYMIISIGAKHGVKFS